MNVDEKYIPAVLIQQDKSGIIAEDSDGMLALKGYHRIVGSIEEM